MQRIFTLIAVTNQTSSQEEDGSANHSQDGDESPSDRNDASSINKEEKQEDISSKDDE